MSRLFPVLVLVLLTGCESQVPSPERQTQLAIQRQTHEYQEDRLREIYRNAFTHGFLEAWEKDHGGPIDIFDSTDPDGDAAYLMGYEDGQRAAAKAKLEAATKLEEQKH